MAETKHAKGLRPITQQQLLMIGFYLAGATKTDSMRMAGHSEKSARISHSRAFKNPVVVKEIERQQEKLRKKYELDEDWVIQRLMRIADSGTILAKFKKVQSDGSLDWDFTGATEDELASINELTVITTETEKGVVTKMKIGSESPKAALDSLCRKLGLFQDITINIGEVSLADRITRGRERSRIAHKQAGDDAKVINP